MLSDYEAESVYSDKDRQLANLRGESLPEYVIVSGDKYPKANIQTYYDRGKLHAFIEIAVPGLNDKQIDLTMEDGCLIIKGNKSFHQPYTKDDSFTAQETAYKLQELHKSTFRRRFDLNRILYGIDTKNISITHNNGMLFIIIPSMNTSILPKATPLDWWKLKDMK